MNVYIVTWLDEYENIRADQIEACDCVVACHSVDCDVCDVISVMRIYNG